MKWKIAVVILTILILVSATHSWSHKQSSQSTPKAAATANWEPVKNGVRVLRVWKNGGAAWPQVAILELSSQEYSTFKKDTSKYVNDNKIFPVAVQPDATATQIGADPAATYAGLWTVTCVHTMTSRMTSTASYAESAPRQ